MGTQQFCLRWNNHQLNMLNVFESLLQNEALVDVTLACDGLTMKAHKVVLSACSPYFQALFIDNPCKHPIVILKDVRYCDLKALIDFMYKGEVNVGQDQLNALLNTAESLKIKGLAEVTGGGVSCTNATLEPHVPPALISRLNQTSSSSVNMTGNSVSSSPPPNSASHRHNSGLGNNSMAVDNQKTPPNMPPLLQPLCNASSAIRYSAASTSPPPKRRKTKPRKRIPESALISSDQEDSDALDLANATPEVIETCVDLPLGDHMPPDSSDGKYSDGQDVKPNLSVDIAHQGGNAHHGFHTEASSADDNASPENKLDFHYADLNRSIAVFPQSISTNQNQFPCALPSSLLASQRLGSILPKPPLASSLPPASLSPAPSTSATEATIQDIRRLCHFTRQSQKHKSPWTEDDMVSALESVQCGRLTYALAARKFDIPKATLHYYVILMKAVEAVRSGRMTPEIAAIKYNVRASILIGCLFGGGTEQSRNSSPPPPDRNDVNRREQ